MEVYKYPPSVEWASLLARPDSGLEGVLEAVRPVMERVKKEGDAALKYFTQKFDGVEVEQFLVPDSEIQTACLQVSSALKDAIHTAKQNIGMFHESQRLPVKKIETSPGVVCWQKSVPIQKVGLYIPGGTAPLFSTVLMLAIPAAIGGCREVILCTPPGSDGRINPAILFTAHLCGITRIYRVGGAQAIAAMAYGTQSIPAVDKIFGPGNRYVTAAKQLATLAGTAIDMPAGPSEVLVMADESARPAFVASDLLSQAEHGPDSQVILVTNHEPLIVAVEKEIDQQLKALPRAETAIAALENSRVILLRTMDEMVDFSNRYAPEHLILAIRDHEDVAEKIYNAGSVFLGNFTPESAGDYASGTNHTLPTHGYAKTYSGVNLQSFCKTITFQKISREGLQNLGPVIEVMAEAESLYAHKNAVSLRLKKD